MWVTFPDFPDWLDGEIGVLTKTLGKVLYIPQSHDGKLRVDKKACILWDRRKDVPEYLEVFDPHGLELCMVYA